MCSEWWGTELAQIQSVHPQTGHLQHILSSKGSGTSEKERAEGLQEPEAGQAGVKLSSGQGRSTVPTNPEQLGLPACRQGSRGLTVDDLWREEESVSLIGSAPDGLNMGGGPTLMTVCASTLDWVSYKVELL